jgi:hypothetical protein
METATYTAQARPTAASRLNVLDQQLQRNDIDAPFYRGDVQNTIRDLKKMSYARREKLSFTDDDGKVYSGLQAHLALVSRAQQLYDAHAPATDEQMRKAYEASTLHNAVHLSGSTEFRDMVKAPEHYASIDTIVDKTPAVEAPVVETPLIETPAYSPAKSGFGRFIKNAYRLAATSLLALTLSCGKSDDIEYRVVGAKAVPQASAAETAKPYVAPAPKIEAPVAPKVEAPVYVAPVVEAPKPAPVVETPKPAPVVETPKFVPRPIEPVVVPAPVVEAPKPAPVVETPTPVAPAVPSRMKHDDSSFADDFRLFVKGEAFVARDQSQETIESKILYKPANFGVDVFGQQSWMKQDFDDGKLDGTSARIGVAVSNYFPLGNYDNLFVRAGAYYENRDFTFTPDTGKKFSFGNTAVNALAQLGYVHQGDFVDESMFDDSKTKVLATMAYGSGDVTGDLNGNYRSLRATVNGQQFLADTQLGQMFINGGAGIQRETITQDWLNQIDSAELGFTLMGKHVKAAAAATYRRLVSDVNDVRETSNHVGGKATLGWKPTDWLQLGVEGGYEGGKDGLGGYGGLDVRLFLGGNKKK